MLDYIFSFFTKIAVKDKVKEFLEKIGLYKFIRRLYRSLLMLWGRRGLKLRIKGSNAKIIVSNPNELNLYRYLDNEQDFIEELLKRIETNTVFYDIGAHVGLYSLLVAKCKIRPKFVYSWEPEPFNFKRLNENIELNKINNARAFQVALGNENNMLKLYTKAEEPGSLTPSLIGEFSFSRRVKVVRGDDFVSEKNLYLPSIIKIDVEGYEYNVLKGFRETISKARPIIFLEIHPSFLEKMGSSEKEVLDFFHNLNYKALSVFPRGNQKHYILSHI
jgi:FkbM family methyltransferase